MNTGNYKEITGDLIVLAKQGYFDVIVHGVNCMCRMKRGIAPQMAEAFGCDVFQLEHPDSSGNINKLGQIDYEGTVFHGYPFFVVNAYTQYNWDSKTKPFDYIAFQLVCKKLNHMFKGKHIGMPKIGAGLAGGDWQTIKTIIQKELKDCDVTVVIYKP